MTYDQEVKVGAAVFRFPADKPPRGLAAVLAGKGAPRARRKAAPQLLALHEGQEVAYQRAIASGSWAPVPATPADLTRPRADAIVVALNTHRRYRGSTEEVHHTMPSNTATAKRKTTTSTARKASTAKRTNGAKPESKRAGITAMQAAEKVLRQAAGPMKVAEIAAAAVKLRDFKPTGKTPEASVAARVHVSAKTPGGVFVRVDRGVVDLRELNPKARKQRPAGEQAEQVAA